ncbi:hypothetical protein [Vibrio navarrensis]|uniref:hypothetical protein n=1 Tax=Vibrio navarrensis TaxID=29495 RepID=UPI00186908F2|nr:hypothetical protein [Vibrio navarrensis]
MKNSVSSKGLFPISMLIFVLGITLSFSIGVAFGASWAFSSDSITSWISAIATVVIAVLTIVLAKETWNLRLAQIDQLADFRKEMIRPNIAFGLSNSKSGSDLVELVVDSNGKGIARNIFFEIHDENGHPFVSGDNFVTDRLLSLRFITHGIKSLGPEQKIDTFLFSFSEARERVENLFDLVIRVTINFEDVKGHKYSHSTFIDFSCYVGIQLSAEGDPQYRISRDIRQIRKLFERLEKKGS